MDNVDEKTRSRMMSGIHAKNTKSELTVRRLLHRCGFRYRLHDSKLPGKPDMVLPKYKAAIFVHGCFWHGHDCKFFRLPGTRTEFWKKKIVGNCERDKQVVIALNGSGWRVAIVWECALRGSDAKPEFVAEQLMDWLSGSCTKLLLWEIRG